MNCAELSRREDSTNFFNSSLFFKLVQLEKIQTLIWSFDIIFKAETLMASMAFLSIFGISSGDMPPRR